MKRCSLRPGRACARPISPPSAVTAALFFAGAWERRWIADDGLIVLRTVRNMLAGNGPVFNAGERVEANTSTLWTFLIYAMQRVMQLPQIEIVALIAALSTSLLFFSSSSESTPISRSMLKESKSSRSSSSGETIWMS